MPDRYTPGYTPSKDPGQGRTPADVDPRRLLLTTMFRLGDRSEAIGLANDHCRPFRYVLLLRETGLAGETVRWHMKQLVNDGLAYEHRNGWGLQRRGVAAAARMLDESQTHADGEERCDDGERSPLSADLDIRKACAEVVNGLWAVTLQQADAGADLQQVRFSLADIDEQCPTVGTADAQAILGILHKRQLVRFDGGYALTISGLREAHRFCDYADVDELLERNFRGQRAAREAAASRARAGRQ